MKFSVQRVILFAAAALVGCLATAINAASPQEILVPFNDLLPPLLEETIVPATEAAKPVAEPELSAAEQVAGLKVEAVVEGTEAASAKATVALPKPIVLKTAIKQTKTEKKPLKKSYYQQQQQLKQHDQHQNDQERTTGRRPPKGVLPTLTPFPRHLKK